MRVVTWPYPKDPSDDAWYAYDWSDLLAEGDTVASQTVSRVSGDVVLGLDRVGADGVSSEVKLSGGTVATVSRFHFHCVTAASPPDEFDALVDLPVRIRNR